MILALIIIVILLLFIYPILKISSECSREEEQREIEWLLQESGKLKKD